MPCNGAASCLLLVCCRLTLVHPKFEIVACAVFGAVVSHHFSRAFTAQTVHGGRMLLFMSFLSGFCWLERALNASSDGARTGL